MALAGVAGPFDQSAARFAGVVAMARSQALPQVQAQLKGPASPDAKDALELALRRAVRETLAAGGAAAGAGADAYLERVLDLAVWAGEHDLTAETAPFALLEDLFELKPIAECARWFEFVRSRLPALTSARLWTKKNQLSLLALCNGLLRRLSKPTDAPVCGAVLMLLAHVFPVDERSGVNVNAKFHTENKTIIEGTAPAAATAAAAAAAAAVAGAPNGVAKMDTDSASAAGAGGDEKGAAAALVDFRFYRTLWELQAIFSNPPSVSDAITWKALFAGMDTILQAFEGSPLSEKDALTATGSSRSTFPKFLTSQRLTNLQLRDPEFRRHVLLQALLLFQHLSLLRAPKDRFVPNKAQADTLRVYTERVERVLRATPPFGAAFARDVNVALERERHWIAWKEAKPTPCAPIEKKPTTTLGAPLELESEADKRAAAAKGGLGAGRQHKRKGAAPKRQKREVMGTAELARLWSGDDNDESLRDRNFTPNHEDHIEQLLDEEDDTTVDAASALKNDRRFTWRLLRLLMREDLINFTKANGVLAALIPDAKKQRDDKKRGGPAAAAAAAASSAAPVLLTATSTNGAVTPTAAAAAATDVKPAAAATPAAAVAPPKPAAVSMPPPAPVLVPGAAASATPVRAASAAAASAATPTAPPPSSAATQTAKVEPAAPPAAAAPAPAAAAAAVAAASPTAGAKRKRDDGGMTDDA